MKRGIVGVLIFIFVISVAFVSAGGTICKSLDIMLVIDKSNSMGVCSADGITCWTEPGDKMSYEKAAASNFVDKVSASSKAPFLNRLGVISFAAGSFTNVEHQIQPVPDYQSTIKTSINNIILAGSTNIGEGFQKTITHLLNNPRPEADKVIIFMTDGVPTQGGIVNGETLDSVTYAKNRSNYAKSLGYKVIIIGLGIDEFVFDSYCTKNCINNPTEARTFLKSLATDPITDFYDVGLATELNEVYQDIATDIICECGDEIAQSINNEQCDGLDFVPDNDATSRTCNQVSSSYLPGIGSLSCYAPTTTNQCKYDFSNCYEAISPTITITLPVNGETVKTDVTNFKATASGKLVIGGADVPMNNINQWKINVDGVNYTFSGSGSTLDQFMTIGNGQHTIIIYGRNIYGKWGASAPIVYTVDIPKELYWSNSAQTARISSAYVGETVRMVITNTDAATFQVYADPIFFRNFPGSKSGKNVTASWTISYPDYIGLKTGDPSKVIFYVVKTGSTLLEVKLHDPELYWAKTSGIKTSQIDLSTESTVRLVKTNTGLAPGTTVNIDIFERDAPTLYDQINTAPIVGTVNNTGALIADWNVLADADNIKSKTSDFENFTFKVGTEYSSDLKVIFPANFTWRNWSNENQVITEANVGENVTIYIQYTGLPAGPASVEVWDDDGASGDDKIRTSDVRGVITGVVDSFGTFRAEMKIDGTDWNAGNDGNDADNGLEFFFRVVGGNPADPNGMTILKVNNPFTAEKETYWANPITNNSIFAAQTQQTVRLVVNNSGLNEGDTATFTIKEEDGLIGDDTIRTLTAVMSNNLLFADWYISAEDFEIGEKDDNQFYFTVSVSGVPDSGFLTVTEDTIDDPFTIEIMNPPCGSDFDITEAFDLKINTTDEDDEVTGKVTISNASGEIFSQDLVEGILTIPSTSFVTYAGTYKIVADGTNNDGKRERAIINIIIINPGVDGKYVAACIDEPKDFSFIDAGRYGIIEFNASSTRGLSNLGGVKTEIAKSEMLFNWIFSDENRDNPYRDGADPQRRSYEFFKVYIPVKENWGDLEVALK